jgi:hypothetical protein
MRRFNFEIIPSAQLTCRAKREVPTRDLLRLMVAKHRRREIIQDRTVNDLVPDTFSICKPASRRKSTLTVATVRFANGNQFNYRNFVISTAHPALSAWIAHFGRSDGGLIIWDGIAQSIVQTATHQAEVLAVADATLSIDELLEVEAAPTSE